MIKSDERGKKMREIEFRGKTTSEVWGGNQVEDGTWVYGFYRDKVGLPVISQFETERCDYVDYEIDRNTLGQYTGLKDKNGKKIFEGDIVKDILGQIGQIVYKEKYSAFVVDKWEVGYALWFDKGIEVIGNIYDNPELLGE